MDRASQVAINELKRNFAVSVPFGAARELGKKNQGSEISHYRVEWDVRADFNSTDADMSTAGFYDVRALANDDIALTCDDASPCAFALGAEVQTLDVYSGDTNPLDGGEYGLSFTAGEAGSTPAISPSCIEYNAEAGVLEAAIELLTGSSGGDVLVARETITDPGPGYRYWITFVGAAVIGDVQELDYTDTAGGTCAQWEVDGVATTQHQLHVETQVK